MGTKRRSVKTVKANDTKKDWPTWLKQAKVGNAKVEIETNEIVIWKGGIWKGGIWEDGIWEGGIWKGGIWEDGIWEGGIWEGGRWEGGRWDGQEDRLFYMASGLGIVFDQSGYGRAYRTTLKNGRGRWNPRFTQINGKYYEEGLPVAGSGTCTFGIHVTSAQRAWTYFGVDPNCEFWEVTFKKEDLLDCDGEKARIRGGEFKRIERPF